MNEAALQKLYDYAAEKKIDLDADDPGVRFKNWLKAEAGAASKFPDLFEPELGAKSAHRVVNKAETKKSSEAQSGLDLFTLEEQVTRMRMLAINHELVGEVNPTWPMIYGAAENRAQAKHPLLFSDYERDQISGIQYARDHLAIGTGQRIRDEATAKGIRLSKLVYFDQLADLGQVSVNDLQRLFPGWTATKIAEFVAAI